MVEGKFLTARLAQLREQEDPRLGGVVAAPNVGAYPFRDQRHVHHRHGAAPGITPDRTIGTELRENSMVQSETGLLGKLPHSTVDQFLVGLEESAGQCPSTPIGMASPPDEEDAPGTAQLGEYHDVDRDSNRRERREIRWREQRPSRRR